MNLTGFVGAGGGCVGKVGGITMLAKCDELLPLELATRSTLWEESVSSASRARREAFSGRPDDVDMTSSVISTMSLELDSAEGDRVRCRLRNPEVDNCVGYARL